MKSKLIVAVLGVLSLSSSGAFAQNTAISPIPSWEVASEFNDSANPSGVWSYCTKATMLANSCSLLSTPYTFGWGGYDLTDILGWTDPTVSLASVLHNVHSVPFNTSNSYPYPITLPAHAIALSPGAGGTYAVLRFTAPARGSYKVSGQFYSLDGSNSGAYWNTTDVEIVKNNSTVVFSGTTDYVNGPKWASFTSKTVALNAGNTLDFQVGFGNGNNFFDTDGLNAVIEKIK